MNLEEKILQSSRKNIANILSQNREVEGFTSRKIWELAQSKNNFVVIGLRRIGKTELLKQLVKKHFVDKTIVPSGNHEVHLKESFKDEVASDLKSAKELNPILAKQRSNSKILYIKLDAIELFYLKEEDKKRIPIVVKNLIQKIDFNLLLVDEIQVLENWNIFIKDMVDEFGDEIQIYATGSNANAIFNSSEHGLGRFYTRFFGVLSFNESQIVKKNHNLATYIDFNHFPEYKPEQYQEEMWQLVIEKAFIDCSSRRDTLFKVLLQIIKDVGCETNKSTISKRSGINQTHINDYINDLVDSQLVFKILNISKSSQNIKLYPLIPSLYGLVKGKKFSNLENDIKGHVFEQFVLIQILSQKTKLSERMMIGFYRGKIGNKIYEIDFIINGKLVEVKYSHDIKDLEKYLEIANHLQKKELYFIYRGENRSLQKKGIKIELINWKDINNYGL